MGIHEGSRYQNASVYYFVDEDKGVVPIIGRREPIEIPQDGEVVKHVFKEDETLDYLAYEYYNDSSLWWAILDVNDYDVPWDIEPGVTLTIPTIDTLRRALNG